VEVQTEISNLQTAGPTVPTDVEITESQVDKFVDNMLFVFGEIFEHGFAILQKEKFLVKCLLAMLFLIF
jgi:hypothetical protein